MAIFLGEHTHKTQTSTTATEKRTKTINNAKARKDLPFATFWSLIVSMVKKLAKQNENKRRKTVDLYTHAHFIISTEEKLCIKGISFDFPNVLLMFL